MSRWITDWNPEDEAFWKKTGERIARRNLIWSIVAENIGFSVWLMWSVTAARLPKAGFSYTTDQLFLLVALPGLLGAILRFLYTFAVPKFGGRNWTIASVLLLLVPTLSLAFFVSRPETPFWLMAMAAATAGLGGGNFASSMANISFFYPDKKKGFALGLNAAGGNIGVSNVQLLAPIVFTIGGGLHLAYGGLMWLPLMAIAAFGAVAYMDNLTTSRSTFKEQLTVAKRKHTWIMAWLYIGTFGSFVGYSAAFPLLLKTQFPDVTANLAFIGALVGSVARPLGGLLADKIGGARVTFWNFVAMGLATLGVQHFISVKSFPGFLASFLAVFVTTGLGNGSTFRMIPTIFRAEALRGLEKGSVELRERALAIGRRDSAAVIGFASAIGALGGFFIPQAFGASIRATQGLGTAFAGFLVFYVSCIAMTWWFYTRTSLLAARAPSVLEANVLDMPGGAPLAVVVGCPACAIGLHGSSRARRQRPRQRAGSIKVGWPRSASMAARSRRMVPSSATHRTAALTAAVTVPAKMPGATARSSMRCAMQTLPPTWAPAWTRPQTPADATPRPTPGPIREFVAAAGSAARPRSTAARPAASTRVC